MFRKLFCLSSVLCAVTGVCLDYWVTFGSSCYYFAHLPTDNVTWQEASQACSWMKSHLVIVNNKAENDFLFKYIAELSPVNNDDQYWTFGNDIHTENQWNWGFSQNRITSTFWQPGEPSNNGFGVVEDCLALRSIWHAWNDESCYHTEYYICEMPANGEVSIVG